MDDGTAREVLGVGAGASADDVRTAYRALLRRHHPDVSAGPTSTATAMTQRLTAAYETLRAAPGAEVVAPIEVVVDGETVVLPFPPDEAFLLLLDAAATVGEVVYVDPEAGLLEVLTAFEGGGTASLVVSLQGRAATGSTDAFCTVADLGTGPIADAVALADALAAAVGRS